MSPLKILNLITPDKPPTCGAVIAAAGNCRRCKGEDKLLFEINGKPVLAYTIEAFQNCGNIREIIVVTRAEQLETVAGICGKHKLGKVSKVIAGGETRTESVFNGVFALSKKAKLVAIHDGARPCISVRLIEETIKKAAKYHAAAPGIPVISTIKRAGAALQGDYGPVIDETVDRGGLFEIQTPQIFRAEIIKAGLTKAVKNSLVLTDDCMAVEMLGMPVHIVEGERSNIKITEPDDLKIAEMLLAYRKGQICV